MHNVQENFNTTTSAEFAELVEACGYKVSTCNHLSIVQWTPTAINTIMPPVKGLIYNTVSGNIMAPGVHIPLAEKPVNSVCVGYSLPVDGIMVRAWWNGDKWNWSTNGTIFPQKIGVNNFQQLLEDAMQTSITGGFFDASDDGLDAELNRQRENCFFFILQHVENPILLMPKENALTLVRVLDRSGNITNEYDQYFANRRDIMCTSIEVADIRFQLMGGKRLETIQEIMVHDPYRPLEAEEVGVIYHYADGTTFRRLTERAADAQWLRGNFPTVQQQFVYHVLDSGFSTSSDIALDKWTAEIGLNPLYRYKRYFPWHAATIKGLTAFFSRSYLARPSLGEKKNVKKLKELADKYMEIIRTIENRGKWTYTKQEGSDQVVVSVPYMGDFPDAESAEHSVQEYLESPDLLTYTYNI